MHNRLLVTFDKKLAKTSAEARQYAFDALSQDETFVGEGGRFGSPVADWFVIGGRWSGELSDATWAKEVVKQIQAIEKQADIQIAGCFYGNDTQKQKQAELRAKAEQMYQEAIPKQWKNKGLVYDRFVDNHEYDETGFEDDAMLVTKELYQLFLKAYKGQDKGESEEWGDVEFVDLDWEQVSPKFINQKWLVVADCHS